MRAVTADGRFVDGYDTTPQVLAKVPHLPQTDGEADLDRSKRPGDGRLISQRLSAKLLLAGGVLVVLAAILPLTLNKMRGSGSGQEGQSWRPDNPAPDAAEAPPWNAASPQANTVQPIEPNAAVAPLATQPPPSWNSGDLPQSLGESSPPPAAGRRRQRRSRDWETTPVMTPPASLLGPAIGAGMDQPARRAVDVGKCAGLEPTITRHPGGVPGGQPFGIDRTGRFAVARSCRSAGERSSGFRPCADS